MLGKLIKNEFKAGLHSVALVYVAAAGAMLAMAFSLLFNLTWLTAIALLAVVFVAFCILAVTVISIITSFNKTLYRDQGYLTFTLPVTSGQILFTKTLCSCVWLVISYVAVVAIYAGVFTMVFSMAKDQIGEQDLEMIKTYINMLIALPDKGTVISALSALLIRVFLLILFAVSEVFFSITLSNVRPFQRQGFLPAVLIFVVTFTVTQIISTILTAKVPLSVTVSLSEGLELQRGLAANTLTNFGVADILFQFALTCFFLWMISWLMNHKINLK